MLLIISEEMRIFFWIILQFLGLFIFSVSLFAIMFYSIKTNNYILLIVDLLVALIFGWFMGKTEKKESIPLIGSLKKFFKKKSS
jgi:c-di-AMP phosphodiesterase-like protein